jgi:hypothetical protein
MDVRNESLAKNIWEVLQQFKLAPEEIVKIKAGASTEYIRTLTY